MRAPCAGDLRGNSTLTFGGVHVKFNVLEILARRAGEIFSCEYSHRKKFSRHLEFFMQWKTGEDWRKKKGLPRG